MSILRKKACTWGHADAIFKPDKKYIYLQASLSQQAEKGEEMKVLSLFDGMSCARIALDRAGIEVSKYYSSEIDKYSMKVSEKNYPDIIQLGSIEEWKSWDIEKPDLIVAGSPCQGFSVAGKGLNFDDPRSKLFFVFVDVLKHYKPKYFLLENVKMKKEWQKVISDILGVEPMEINSSLVSAQNRKRLYWFNWSVDQPEDKGILLKDIIENEVSFSDKSQTIPATIYKENEKSMLKRKKYGLLTGVIKNRGKYELRNKKAMCIDANYHKGADNHGQRTLITNCIEVGKANIKGFDSIKRVYSVDGKSISLQTSSGGNREPKIAIDQIHWRKLTPIECERLQTVPDQFTEGVSNTQRYKMLGNGFTVDVMAHILRGINESI